MTTWLPTSRHSRPRVTPRGGNIPVICAAVALLVAMTAYLTMSPRHPIAEDAATLAGP